MKAVTRVWVVVSVAASVLATQSLGFAPTAGAGGSTQASFVDYAQCANDAPPSTSTACPSGWINGILISGNSHYHEDEVTPQRAEVVVPKGSPTTGRTMTFRYLARKGTVHAYDSLATWNFTQTTADRCQGLTATNCVKTAVSQFPIPADPTVVADTGPGSATSGHQLPGQQMNMYGGTITAISVPSHDNAGGPGDDYATVKVTYSVPSTASPVKVQLLFGGHLAAAGGPRGWGVGLGSASINGGPYHIKWDATDGLSIGNRDNQIQSSAILTSAALKVVKTADKSSVSSGSPIGFTITVTNTGTAPASNASLSDPLPSGTGILWSVNPAYPGPGTCTLNATPPQTLNCAFGTLAVGQVASVHILSATTGQTSGTFTNIATAQADGVPPTTGTDSVTVLKPSLSIVKTADNATVNAGSPIGYTITVSNGGPGVATAVTLSDALPSGTGVNWSVTPNYPGPGICGINGSPPNPQTLNCSFGDLAPNASVSVHVLSQTTSATTGTFSNTAVAQASNNPPVTSTTVVITVNKPSLKVTKTADNASVSAGQNIGFTITVSNGGPGLASNVSVTDPLPGATGINWSINPPYTGPGTCAISTGGSPPSQTLSCSGFDLTAGASMSVHVVSATTKDTSGTFTNTATAKADNNPPVSSTAVTVTVNAAGLYINKVALPAIVNAGSPVTFSITVGNNGPGTAFAVGLNDPLPSGTDIFWTITPNYAGPGMCAITGSAGSQVLNCTFGDLAPGASLNIKIVSPTSFASPDSLTNMATVTASNSNPRSSTATATITKPKLTITKTADSAQVDAGSPIGFTIAVSNTGTGAATAVSLTDPLPGGTGINWSISPAYPGPGTCTVNPTPPQTLTCAFGDLAPNTSVSVHVLSQTTASTTGTFSNTATAQATNHPPVTSTTVTVTVNQPSLSITKTADSATVTPGTTIGFTIAVANGGPGAANGVSVSDPLPTGNGLAWTVNPNYTGPGTCSIAGTAPNAQTLSCTVSTLAANSSFSVHISSPTTTASCGTYTNTASVSASNSLAVAPSSASIFVDCRAQLTLTKTACPATAVPGGFLTYTLTYGNTGTAAATGTVLTDTLPAGVTVTDNGGGVLNATSTTLSWSLGPVPIGATGTKTFTVAVPTGADGSSLVNNAAITSATANPTTVTAQVTTPVSSAGANASGLAYGLNLNVLGGTVNFGPAPTTQVKNPDTLANVNVPSTATVSLLNVTNSPSVTSAGANDTAIATTVGTNLTLPGITVHADTVVARSESHATALSAGSSLAGSRVQNLIINTVTYGDITVPTVIVVKDPTTGVALGEVDVLQSTGTGASNGVVQPTGGSFSSGLTVEGLHVTVYDVAATPVNEASTAIVAHAESTATFPNGLACGTTPPSVRGQAYLLDTPHVSPPLAASTLGLVNLPVTGGTVDGTVATFDPLGVGTGTTHTDGALSTPEAHSKATASGLNLLTGAITATTVQATSDTSGTTPTGATTIEHLVIAGTDICTTLGLTATCQPKANTLVLLGTTLIAVLNEQISSTSLTSREERTNAVHIYVIGAGNPLNLPAGAEVVISSAFSGTSS